MYRECRQSTGSICVEIEALNISGIKEQLIKYVDENTKNGIEDNLRKAQEAVELASLKANEAKISADNAAISASQVVDSLNNYYQKNEIDDKISEVNNSLSSIESTVAGCQIKDNLVTTIDADSGDEQYPSAKAVYDIVGKVETFLSEV